MANEFNPDSYLKESSEAPNGLEPSKGFDPDSYLAKPEAPVLQVSLKEAANKNPDEYAKVVNLANKNKLPVDFTERNYQDLEKESRNHQQMYSEIEKKTPAFAGWLQDAKNAALVNDELPQQQKIEEDVREYGLLNEAYNALGVGIARIGSDISKIPALAYDVAAIPQNLLNKAIGRDVEVRSPEFLRDNLATQFYDKQSEAFAKEAPSLDNSITDEISKGNYSKAGRTLAIQFIANAPQQAALLMGGIMGHAGKALAAAGATSAAAKNVENQEAGIDPIVGVGNALATGGLEAAFESVGTMGVLKSWEGVIAKNFGKNISGQVIKDFAKTMLYSMAAEGNEEALTSVAQDLTDYITGVNPDALEGIGQRALDAGFIGAASGGLMTSPGAVGAANARRAKEKSVKMAQDFYANMGETVKNLKLKERSPEAQQQYLEAATKGTQVENVYISTEAIETYFQGPKKAGEQVGENVPQGTQDNTETLKALQELGLIEKYEEAKRTGADMEIPFAEWAVKTSGDPIYNALSKDIKFNVDEPSQQEIDQEREAERQMLEAEAKAAEENDRIENVKALEQSSKAVSQDVEKQLRESGQSASQAKAQAKLYESTFRSLGERSGIDPLELYNRYNLSIGRGEVAPIQEGDQVLNQGILKTDADVRPTFEAPDTAERYAQLPDTMGGKRLDTDTARMLDEQYASGREGAILSLDATDYPASDFTQREYEKRVSELKPQDVVQIFAGGSGSGKTTIQTTYAEAIAGDDIILDTTSANYDLLKKRIEMVLEKDGDVVLTYIYRPFNKAAQGVKERFEKTGRIVTPDYLAYTHVNALENILRIAEEYKGDNRVTVEVFDNTKDKPVNITVEELAEKSYIKSDETKEEAVSRLQKFAETKLKPSLEEIERTKKSASERVSSQNERANGETTTEAGSDSLTLKQSAPTYSRVEQLITDKMGGSASPDQIKGMLRDMKPEELKWLGINEFLKGKTKVTKEEMLEHIRGNMVEIVDVTNGNQHAQITSEDFMSNYEVEDLEIEGLQAQHGYIVPDEFKDIIEYAEIEEFEDGYWVTINGNSTGEQYNRMENAIIAIEQFITDASGIQFSDNFESQDGTKFSNYVLPGGENYREVLFTLPELGSREPLTDKELKRYEVLRKKVDSHRLGYDGLTPKQKKEYDYFAEKSFQENKGKYSSSHWDEKNVLAHVRLNDRTDADGKKVLFVEEIQSDWHQEGRKKGYKGDAPDVKVEIARLESEMNSLADQYKPMALDNPDRKPLVEKYKELQKQKSQLENSDYKSSRAVPDAPFRKTWHEYAMKRIIRMAAEGGYDKVAWTTGEQQAERYDLSKQVDEVQAKKNEDGTYAIKVRKDDSVVHDVSSIKESDLESQLGKDLAAKIIAKEGTLVELTDSNEEIFSYEGVDLKVGGEGMKGFYDNILVKSTDKLVKKFGAKVGETKLGEDSSSAFTVWDNEENEPMLVFPSKEDALEFVREEVDSDLEVRSGNLLDGSDETEVHSFDITPQLRDEALNVGFSLFQDERGQIRFGKNGINIDLFKNADASTFLHETGHFYFKVLGDLAKSESAPQQIKDDYDTLLKWMNVTDPDNISVDAQEQFARGFEAYLLEGKAPTKELRSAFARFKVWLLDVYKSIRNLNVELSDDIRGVMNRLVATEEQIEIANQEIQRVPLFQDARAMGMSEAQANKYTEMRLEAQETASEQLAAEMLKDHYKTKQKEYKKKRRAVREEVDAEVSKYQAYVTLDQLRTGQQASGLPMRLDRAAVVEMTNPGFLQRLPKPIVYTKKGEAGLHPDVAASYMGYESGDAMLADLANLPPKQQVIDSITDQRMKELYPDIVTPQSAPQQAMEAVHNDKQAEVLMLELQMLAGQDFKGFMKNVVAKTVKRLPTRKIVQEEADNIISQRKITDIKPYIYKRAEIKSAKLAGEALAKGDIDAAFDYKRKELLNFELYNSANRALEQIKKDKQLYKKLAKKDDDLSKTRDIDYINAARALLAEYGLGDTEKTPVEYLEKVRSYNPEQYEALVSIIEASLESEATNYEQMTYQDFRGMNDVVKALWDLSKEAKTIEIDGKKESLNQAREDLSNRLEEISKPQESKKYTQSMDDVDKKKTVLLGAWAKLRRFEHWVDSMDDGNINGVFRKYLYQPVSEATDKYILKRAEYIKRYKAEFDKLKVDPKKSIVSDELGHKFFNKYEILGALLHRGNNSNFEKLLVGRNWGSVNEAGQLDSTRWDAFETRMQNEGILTKQDYDFVQTVWDMMDELKPDAQKSNKRVFGFYFDEITANEFTNRFGTYKGGYAPAAIDTDLVSTIRNKQLRDQIINGQDAYAMPYSGGKGFTKSRVNSNKPLALDLRIFSSHLDQVLRFTYVKPAVMDAAKVLLNDDFKAKMDAFDPKIVEDMILPALNRADKGTARSMSDATSRGLMRYANKFKTNASMQLMFVNIPNTLQQITGFSVAALKVSGLKMGESTLNYMKRSKEMTQEISEKSTFMQTRFENQMFEIERDIENIMKGKTDTIDKMKDWSLKHMYVAQSMAQNMIDAIIWEASYNQSINENLGEKEAIRKADSVVRTTQSSFRPMDVSASESNPFFGLVQMFYSYFNTMLNVNAAEFEKLMRSDLGLKKKFQKGAIIYTLGYMIPAFVGDLVVQALRGLDEDDDDEITDDLLSTFFWSQIRFGAAMIPLAGSPVMAGINRANDKPWDDRSSMSPAFTGLTTIGGTVIDTGKAIFSEDEVSAKRLSKDALTSIGLLSGLPIGAASRPVGYLIDVEEGNKDPTGPIDFTRGLISGN